MFQVAVPFAVFAGVDNRNAARGLLNLRLAKFIHQVSSFGLGGK
jgi:hypothetical protein